MTIAAWLQRNASAHAHDPALAIGPRPLKSYSELAASVAGVAGWLAKVTKRGAAPVAIVSDTRVEAFESLLACWWAGLSAATIDPRLGDAFVADALAVSGARIVLACPNGARAVAATVRETPERLVVFGGFEHRRAQAHGVVELQPSAKNALAWIRFAPDAEGAPRGAAFTHRSLMYLALSILAELDAVTPRDAQIHAESWCGESGLLLLPTLARAGVNIAPESGGADAAELVEVAGAWRRASVLASPGLLSAMTRCEIDYDASAFRSILVGAAPASAERITAALDRLGPRVAKVYGREEFPLGLGRLNRHDVAARSEPGWRARLETTGRAFLLTEIAAFDSAGRELPAGEIGEFCAKGPLRMQSYWRDPKGTNQAMRREWLRTGDHGCVDASGHLRLLGRMADLIRVGGRVAPAEEAEAALLRAPGIAEAAVVQPRAPEAGARIAAYLSMSASAETEAPPQDRLRALVADAVGAPLDCVAIRADAELPRDLHGAIDRAALRRIEKARLELT